MTVQSYDFNKELSWKTDIPVGPGDRRMGLEWESLQETREEP